MEHCSIKFLIEHCSIEFLIERCSIHFQMEQCSIRTLTEQHTLANPATLSHTNTICLVFLCDLVRHVINKTVV